MNNKTLPWLEDVRQTVLARRVSMPHAFLLVGPKNIGKQLLAENIAGALLCRRPRGGLACGECEACHWMGQRSHPDFRLISPDSDEPPESEGRAPARASTTIRIHQIRALQDWLAVGSHQGGWRIAIVCPAEAMNANTSNALLKTLEEPPPSTLLLLVCHHPDRLLPTLRSRCQTVHCPPPSRQEALEWLRGQQLDRAGERLALASGAPLELTADTSQIEAARMLVESLTASRPAIFEVAARLSRFSSLTIADLLQKWIYDIFRTRRKLSIRYYQRHAGALEQAAASLNPNRLLKLESRLREARKTAEHPLNARLVLEDLLVDYAEAIDARND